MEVLDKPMGSMGGQSRRTSSRMLIPDVDTGCAATAG